MAPAEAPGTPLERFDKNRLVTRAGRTLVVCGGDAFADTATTPFAGHAGHADRRL